MVQNLYGKMAALYFPRRFQNKLHPYIPPSSDKDKKARPFVTLTYAQSLDGQISLSPSLPTALSGPSSKAMTHYLRSTHQAILVGSGTALADDPGLNCRLDEVLSQTSPTDAPTIALERQPQPIILDRRGRWNLSIDSKIIKLAAERKGRPPWIMISNSAYSKLSEITRNAVTNVGGQFLKLKDDASFTTVLDLLFSMGINSIMIEGGGTIINEILSKYQDNIDSLIITVAPLFLGRGGVLISPNRQDMSLPAVKLLDVTYLTLDRDIILCSRIDSNK